MVRLKVCVVCLKKKKKSPWNYQRKLSEKVNETLVLKDDLRKLEKVTESSQGSKSVKEQVKALLKRIEDLKNENSELKQRVEQLKKAPAAASPEEGGMPENKVILKLKKNLQDQNEWKVLC